MYPLGENPFFDGRFGEGDEPREGDMGGYTEPVLYYKRERGGYEGADEGLITEGPWLAPGNPWW